MQFDERMAAQAQRNAVIPLDQRLARIHDLEKEIVDARAKPQSIYDNAVATQRLEIERRGLLDELRGEIRVVVDNSEFYE